ncbi:alpha/beta fold hydrolase [Actibacterium pelagium]|uniref:Alpha/beta hydrolase n=1 Tax=Actibacterium pelagium TaxID=2029103 RepID=A0A917AD35_9RHOB|nr:alpha/beta hydrolase [Actibacterium pelagium]GGE41484.1 alpha/beta hydrolase [Actibacterium pelagium]
MTKISTVELGRKDAFPVVFAHGWGRDHKDLLATAELVAPSARVILLDLPGFGESPRPEPAWDTIDYAKAVLAHLDGLGVDRFHWVGHSFGGRIGLRLAAMDDSRVEHLFIVAGAGVKRPTTVLERLRGKRRSMIFQQKKAKATTQDALIELEREYGSADYVQSREIGMRDIFLKTIQEDQIAELPKITCPTSLIYGRKDTETPPVVGKLIHEAIPQSEYIECPEYDHHSILSRGRHQIATMVLEQLNGGAK